LTAIKPATQIISKGRQTGQAFSSAFVLALLVLGSLVGRTNCAKALSGQPTDSNLFLTFF
jgi:hypothetical protein